jgi:hypothetical protein
VPKEDATGQPLWGSEDPVHPLPEGYNLIGDLLCEEIVNLTKKKQTGKRDVVRIRESYQTECECIWIRILESGFRNYYADPRFASDPYHTVRTPSSGSDWARTSLVCKGYSASKASVRTRECYAL